MNTVFSIIPILLLIWLMVKKNGMPSHKALPLTALLFYLIVLIIFQYEPVVIHANLIKGLLVAWTPILIIGGAVLLFLTMEITGSISTVKTWLNGITKNKIAQLMMIGWAFPFLIEGASGFGTPAVIAAPVLVGLGYNPVKAAILVLIMNTVPVSFGAVGTPTWFGFSAINLSESETLSVAFKSAAIHSIIAFFIVQIALLQFVKLKDILKNWLFISLSISCTVVPYLIVAVFSYEFPALIGGAVGLSATVLLAKKNIGLVVNNEFENKSEEIEAVPIKHLIKAAFPLWGTIVVLIITRIPQLGIKNLLLSEANSFSISLGMLGDFSISSSLVMSLQNILQTSVEWSIELLYIPALLPFGLISFFTLYIYKTKPTASKELFVNTLSRMKNPAFALFGALVFVNFMMMGGKDSAINNIGNFLAGISGEKWTFVSPFLGAVGSFFSGSATISNLTFAGIQDSIALEVGLNRTTILALQSVGGAFGNMVCINNIVAVVSVLGLINKEGYILKRTVLPTLIYGILAAVLALVLF